jgi:hypothetical protein
LSSFHSLLVSLRALCDEILNQIIFCCRFEVYFCHILLLFYRMIESLQLNDFFILFENIYLAKFSANLDYPLIIFILYMLDYFHLLSFLFLYDFKQ